MRIGWSVALTLIALSCLADYSDSAETDSAETVTCMGGASSTGIVGKGIGKQGVRKMSSGVVKTRVMGPGPMDTPDPFVFLVYHKDNYPKAKDNSMEHPTKRGNGMDFDPAAESRAYHGENGIAGFPSHPHRGLTTITATIDGVVDHADSLKNAGRYGQGDVQWMTAGRGLQHSEMFPLLHKDKPNHMRFFQIWLNHPGKTKMVTPTFAMHWASDVARWESADGLAKATIWAGEHDGVKATGAPPPDTWAADAANDVHIMHITLQAGGRMSLAPSALGDGTNRNLYMIEGTAAVVGGTSVARPDQAGQVTMLETSGAATVDIAAPDGPAQFLLLQGKPIGEKVVQHGPFVMNSQDEIRKAFEDYQRTRFGGWPWPRSDMVFPREKGRFAILDGIETAPPDAAILAEDQV